MITIVPALLYLGVAYAQQDKPGDTNSFLHEMVGDWIGTFDQSTDQVNASTKYFHARARQTGPDSYETVFEYYKLDPETRQPVDAGRSSMATRITPDGTVTNTIAGNGDVLINVKTLRSEQHQFSEVLQMSSPDVLQGSGSGSIKVSSAQSGSGRDGKVVQYASTWSMSNGILRITQQFKVKFKVLFFARTYSITMDHTIRRGSDIMGLIRKAGGNANPGRPGQ